MFTDHELLKLAAKAAGYNFENGVLKNLGSDFEYDGWNPLTDDGDALRLAVKLHISVEHPDPADMGGGYVTARICKTRYKRLYLKRYWFNVDLCEGDAYVATRRAIVRAAAEIGLQMQEDGAA